MYVWQALKPRYDAHFIPVKKAGKIHCVSERPLPDDTDFQAAVEGATALLLVYQRIINNSNTTLRERCHRARAGGCVGKAGAAGGCGVVEE